MMNKNLIFLFLIQFFFLLNSMEHESALNVLQKNAPQNYNLAYAGKINDSIYFAIYDPTYEEPGMKKYKQELDEWYRGTNKEFPSLPYYKLFKAKIGSLNNLEEMSVDPVDRHDGITVVPTSRGHFYFPDTQKNCFLNGVAISLLINAQSN